MCSPKQDVLIHQLKQTLSKHERQFLAAAWTKLGGDTGRQALHVCTRIFEKLVEKRSDVNELFEECAAVKTFSDSRAYDKQALLQDHGCRMAEFVQSVVVALNGDTNQSTSVINVRGIGEQHASMKRGANACGGMTTSMWEAWGTIAADLLTNHQVNRSQRLTQRAWTTMIAVITDQLIAGFDHGRCVIRQLAAAKFTRMACTVTSAMKWKTNFQSSSQTRKARLLRAATIEGESTCSVKEENTASLPSLTVHLASAMPLSTPDLTSLNSEMYQNIGNGLGLISSLDNQSTNSISGSRPGSGRKLPVTPLTISDNLTDSRRFSGESNYSQRLSINSDNSSPVTYGDPRRTSWNNADADPAQFSLSHSASPTGTNQHPAPYAELMTAHWHEHMNKFNPLHSIALNSAAQNATQMVSPRQRRQQMFQKGRSESLPEAEHLLPMTTLPMTQQMLTNSMMRQPVAIAHSLQVSRESEQRSHSASTSPQRRVAGFIYDNAHNFYSSNEQLVPSRRASDNNPQNQYFRTEYDPQDQSLNINIEMTKDRLKTVRIIYPHEMFENNRLLNLTDDGDGLPKVEYCTQQQRRIHLDNHNYSNQPITPGRTHSARIRNASDRQRMMDRPDVDPPQTQTRNAQMRRTRFGAQRGQSSRQLSFDRVF